MSATVTDAPVAIVGAGPVGLATAYVLGRHGVRSVLLDQYGGVNPHPRSHVVNTRSMELMRSWDLYDDIISEAIDLQCGLSFVWKHTVAGEELGRIELAEAPAEHLARRLDASPVTIASCAQDRVQQRLLDAVLAQGMCDVRYGVSVSALVEDGQAVTLEAKVGDRVETIRAEFVVNAEGAVGQLRSALGIDVEGVPEFGRQVNVYFHADLSAWTTQDPSLLFWVLNTGCPGVFVRMGGDRWTFNIGYDPTAETPADFTPERCVDLIRLAVGVPDLEVEVRSVGSWVLGASTAVRYRRGRVFLVGDAAHQFPPTGGLGMNTGLVDADNLGWKLAAVLNGWAGPDLLDSYEAERRPIALANAASSITNAMKMADVGIGPNTLEVAARIESQDASVAAAERARMAQAVPLQRDHFDYLELELGYVYGDPASADPITNPVVGARLPHAWVLFDGQRVSLLDLVPTGFLVLTGVDGQAWLDSLGALDLAVPWVSHRFGDDLAAESAPSWLPPDGVVVVRPDGHLAWTGRLAEHAPSHLVSAVRRACALRDDHTPPDAQAFENQEITR